MHNQESTVVYFLTPDHLTTTCSGMFPFLKHIPMYSRDKKMKFVLRTRYFLKGYWLNQSIHGTDHLLALHQIWLLVSIYGLLTLNYINHAFVRVFDLVNFYAVGKKKKYQLIIIFDFFMNKSLHSVDNLTASITKFAVLSSLIINSKSTTKIIIIHVHVPVINMNVLIQYSDLLM